MASLHFALVHRAKAAHHLEVQIARLLILLRGVFIRIIVFQKDLSFVNPNALGKRGVELQSLPSEKYRGCT